MTISEKISRAKADYDAVYEAGKNAGGGGGQGSYDEGYAAGRKAEYDEFWDTWQENGKRTDYTFGFAYSSFDDATFRPKYPLQPYNADRIFIGARNITEIDVDFSKATNVYWAFRNMHNIVRIGKCDFSSTNSASGTFSFNSVSLKTIDEIVSHKDLVFDGAFAYDFNLENVTFSGVIAQNGLNFQPCTKLSRASIESIMAALSTTTSGLTVTLSKTAVNNAFTTEEWSALVSQHTNWTISLI